MHTSKLPKSYRELIVFARFVVATRMLARHLRIFMLILQNFIKGHISSSGGKVSHSSSAGLSYPNE